jgi:hypothetical protein
MEQRSQNESKIGKKMKNIYLGKKNLYLQSFLQTLFVKNSYKLIIIWKESVSSSNLALREGAWNE